MDQCYNKNEQNKSNYNNIDEIIRLLNTFFSNYQIQLNKNDFIKQAKLDAFLHNDKISADELISNIISYKNSVFNESTLDQIKLHCSTLPTGYLNNLLKPIIKDFINDTQINILNETDRNIIEVSGYCIVISSIFDKLIGKLIASNTVIDEIRFISLSQIHIDKDFEKKYFHGINIVLVAKRINIHGSIKWDISGLNADNNYKDTSAQDGKTSGEDGENGKNGLAGESGGNCFIVTDSIINAENFEIYLNGGNGDEGQNGGNGRNGTDGVDGHEFDFEEMKKECPSACNFVAHIAKIKLLKTLEYIKNKSQTIEIMKLVKKDLVDFAAQWTTGLLTATIGNIGNDIIFEYAYIQSVSPEGNKITYSFYAGGISSFRSGYLLIQGTPGTSGQFGGVGGLGGLGGQGGFAGKIKFANCKSYPIVIHANDGMNGVNGKDGYNGCDGKPGKNGRDIGYLDTSQYKQTIYYEPGEYKIEYFKQSIDCAWCEYEKKYAKIVNFKRYLSSSTNRKCLKQRTSKDIQNYSKNKKPILEDYIKSKYGDLLKNYANVVDDNDTSWMFKNRLKIE